MTTRSGSNYKAGMEEPNTHAEGPRTEEQTASGRALPEISSLTDILRVMMEDRERREREIAEERERREREKRERRETQREEERRRYEEESERRLQQQMELLQRLVAERPAAAQARSPSESEPVKLTRLSESDDIEAYLTTFERMMRAYEVNEERWPFKLAPQLTGKAQQAYAALPPDDANDYETVKAAILRRYDINEETYRQRFRNLKSKTGESPRELVTRLTDLASRWTRECASQQELLDLIVKEQFLYMLPEDVRIAVIEKKPKDSAQASEFAENYLQARSTSTPAKATKTGRLPSTKCPKCGLHGHWARDCPQPKPKQEEPRQTENAKPRHKDGIKCFTCSERGHIAMHCPKKSLYCKPVATHPDQTPTQGQERVFRQGTINGVFRTDIVVDTGATKTLVHRDLVTEDDILDGEIKIKCAHGDVVSYPLAVVKFNIGGQDIITHAAVSNTLPASALLGWDVPQLMSFVNKENDVVEPETPEQALVVLTRGQQEKAKKTLRDEALTGPTPLAGAENMPSTEENGVFDFDDALFPPPGRDKERLTRSQKRENSRQYQGTTASPAEDLDIPADSLKLLQDEDPSLQAACRAADGEPNTAGTGFFRRNGLLYRKYCPPGGEDDDPRAVEQLVLPTKCRMPVVKLAHDIPLSGHLGKRKTRDRILQRFYWPSLYRDVAKYCQACEQCQI